MKGFFKTWGSLTKKRATRFGKAPSRRRYFRAQKRYLMSGGKKGYIGSYF